MGSGWKRECKGGKELKKGSKGRKGPEKGSEGGKGLLSLPLSVSSSHFPSLLICIPIL